MILKRTKLIIFLISLVIVTGIVIFVNSFSEILAEVATGSAIDRNEQKYWVTTGIGGENRISCSQEQYDKYMGDTDIGRTDTLFVVIYEKNLLVPSKQKVIQVKKYKDHWDDTLHKRIIPNKTYYRLAQEDYTSVYNRQSILTRVFECYQSGDSQMKLAADNFVTPYFDNINSIKEWMKQKNNNLQLKPLTIVSDYVKNKWNLEDYVPTIEYSANSPQGLTYEELMKQENKQSVNKAEISDNIQSSHQLPEQLKITFDDQKQVEQIIKEYFTYLEKKDYSSAWELTSIEQKKMYPKEKAIKEHFGIVSIKFISIKGYYPTQEYSTGDVPPNTPTIWFFAKFDIEPNPNTAWTKGVTGRYVNVVKDSDGKWRIDGLATGP